MAEIEKGDVVCHWVFDPKHFSGKPSCLNLDQKIQFNSSNEYKLSVNSRDLCEDFPKKIHELGITQAQDLTERNTERGKDQEETYAGFVSAEVEKVENIEYDDHSFKVEHEPRITGDQDRDNPYHCNIVLNYPNRSNNKKPASAKRTRMVEDLIYTFGREITSQ